MTGLPHIPVLRAGTEYESLETSEVKRYADGATVAVVSQANAGMLRRDLARLPKKLAGLRRLPGERMIAICAEAAERFLSDTLPLSEVGDGAAMHSADDYVAMLSATSGLPHTLVRANMQKIATVLAGMPGILAGLTRGLPASVLDDGRAEVDGMPVSFAPTTPALGVVLPSNSPGVNSLWVPALALKTGVVLKPGREEPWTPLRILRAFLAAGLPPAAANFYPTDHEGAGAILELCGRSLLFGDEKTTAKWSHDHRVELHGPGRSKVVLGPDEAPKWEQHLDVLSRSLLDGGGRSCICASTILVPKESGIAADLGDALARRLSDVRPAAPEDPDAKLSAFANPTFAAYIDQAIEQGLAQGGARDLTAEHRGDSARRVERDGGAYLLPTLIACDSLEHSLARTEYLFPFASLVEVPSSELVASLGPSLVVSAITRDAALRQELLASPEIGRLNLGAMPTTRVEWDQPHEGNLFEHLWMRRAIQLEPGW